jgi:hypothetical protein
MSPDTGPRVSPMYPDRTVGCLVTSSHYPPVCWRLVEEVWCAVPGLDSQALATSEADVNGVELARLDTLQTRSAWRRV